jgi:hypothetical protein
MLLLASRFSDEHVSAAEALTILGLFEATIDRIADRASGTRASQLRGENFSVRGTGVSQGAGELWEPKFQEWWKGPLRW